MPIGFIPQRTGKDDDSKAVIRQGETYQPSLTDSIKAGFAAGLDAPGSLNDDVDSYVINRELGRDPTVLQKVSYTAASAFIDEPAAGQPLSQEDYQNSIYFREDLPYEQGLTTRAAEIRARRHDAENTRNRIFEQSGAIGKAGFFVSSLSGAIADYKNLAAGLATAGAFTGGAATIRSIQAARKATTSLSTVGRVGVIAAESTVATLPAAISGLQNVEATHAEYSVGDALLDLGASALFSVSLEAGVPALGRSVRKFVSPSEREQIAKLAATQVANGEPINTQPLVDMLATERTPVFTTTELDPEIVTRQLPNGSYEARYVTDNPELAKVRVRSKDQATAAQRLSERGDVEVFNQAVVTRELPDGRFEARLRDEEGLAKNLRVVGDSAEEAVQNFRASFRDDDVTAIADQLRLPPEELRAIKEAQKADAAANSFNTETATREAGEELGLDVSRYDELRAELAEAQRIRDEAAKQLELRPRNPERQSNLANAENKLTRARDRFDKFTEGEFNPAVARALGKQNELNIRAQEANAAAQAIRAERARARLRQFAQEQVADPVLSEAPDQFARDINREQPARDAQRAPRENEDVDLTSEATRARKLLEDLLQSEGVNGATRSELEQAIRQIDEQKLRAEKLRELLSCRGS